MNQFHISHFSFRRKRCGILSAVSRRHAFGRTIEADPREEADGRTSQTGGRTGTRRRVSVKSAIALFAILMAVWLLNSGHYTPMLIGFGVASSLFVVYLGLRMGIVDEEGVPIQLLPRTVTFVPWLVKEVFKANVDVAGRILAPRRRPLSPVVFDAPTTQHSDLGRVIYANSITLTPGTVSILVRGNRIKVHGIAHEVADGLLEGDMDRRVTRFEGLGS